MHIVVTGVPGVGKSSFSINLSKLINIPVINTTEFIIKNRLYYMINEYHEYIVKMKAFETSINKFVYKKSFIIEGHILSDIKINNAVALVKREHINTLRKRLEKRHYKEEKIMNNLIAEAIDYCGINAYRHYKRVYEFIRPNYNEILRFINGLEKNKFIDLSNELLKLQ